MQFGALTTKALFCRNANCGYTKIIVCYVIVITINTGGGFLSQPVKIHCIKVCSHIPQKRAQAKRASFREGG